MSILLPILAFVGGAALVAATLLSAIRTFVLPRSAPDRLSSVVFLAVRLGFRLRLMRSLDYSERDRVMAFYAPVRLLALPPVWRTLVLTGYSGILWAIGLPSWGAALRLSGSSLLTLGFADVGGFLQNDVMFTEAALGLALVALLIAYLPTMYAAFARREAAVTLLEVRAGSPPTAVEMVERFTRIGTLDRLGEQWKTAEHAVPMKADRDKAWGDFVGWRVNYDTPLMALARLTLAPESPWLQWRRQ